MSRPLKSFRCWGETRTGQCTKTCLSKLGEDFSFCAEHESQRDLRLRHVQNDISSYEWVRLFGTLQENEIDSVIKPQKPKDRNLKNLADDEENIHTIEIQRPLVRAIGVLRTWAESKKLKSPIVNFPTVVEEYILKRKPTTKSNTLPPVSPSPSPLQRNQKYTQNVVNEFWRGSLQTVRFPSVAQIQQAKLQPKTEVKTVTNENSEFTKVEKECLDHLKKVYSIEDTESVLEITFPVLASLVWFRITLTEDAERRNVLVQRFVEEMADGSGLCLQGNLTRLMNVFSGLDAEVSLQDVDYFDTGPISSSYMQQQVAAAVSKYSKGELKSYEELVLIAQSLMKRANASKEVYEDWMSAIRDFVS